MTAVPTEMLVAEIDTPGQIASVLARLNRGETIAFSHKAGGPLAFTIAKDERGFVLRARDRTALVSGSTFAETWRGRPRIAVESARE